MKRGYKKTDQLLPVDKPSIGVLYHVAWGNSRGVVGRCVSVSEEEKTVILKSPKSNKRWANPVKWSDLRYTRKSQSKIESKKKTQL